MQDFTGVPGRRRPRRDARRDGGARRRPGEDQPARAGRAGHRPLGAGRRVRHAPTRSRINAELEFERNQRALRVPALGPGGVRELQGRAAGHRHRPPGQPRVPRARRVRRRRDAAAAYPDTLVGTDSHTTMVNGLGVLGWGVGGIEAEAAMLGQPMSMLIPQVVGFRLDGELPEGATATDLVLTVTEMLRKTASSASSSSSTAPASRACRSPTARRSATCAPSTARPARSSRSTPRRCATCAFTGRPAEQVALVEAYAKEQGLWHDERRRGADVHATRSSSTSATVEPSLAGPQRPQDRVPLTTPRRRSARR